MNARAILLSAVLAGAAAPLSGCHDDPPVSEWHRTENTSHVDTSTTVVAPAAPAPAPVVAPPAPPPTPPPEPTIVVK